MDEQQSLDAAAREAAFQAAGAQVRELRLARGESGEQFGALIGLSKGKVSEMETGKYQPSLSVALAIEALSEGRIDAAALCEDVRRAREGMALDHAAAGTPAAAEPATGQSPVPSGGVLA